MSSGMTCLSPQDKRRDGGNAKAKAGLAQRLKATSMTHGDMASFDMDDDEDDEDDVGWSSDENMAEINDVGLPLEIDWALRDEELEASLKLECLHARDDDDGGIESESFAFDPSSFLSPAGYLSPLRRDDDDAMALATPFGAAMRDVEDSPSRDSLSDAEKLLMRFDTMNFKIPSPTNSNSARRRRANIFTDDMNPFRMTANTSTAIVSNDSLSPTTKTKATCRRGEGETSSLFNLTISVNDAAGCSATSVAPSVSSPQTPCATPSSDHCNKKKIGSYSPEARRLRIEKFHQKRKNRSWRKSIKYDCRKKLADDRPRIKGRFVRVGSDSKMDDESNKQVPAIPTPRMNAASTAPDTPPLVSPSAQSLVQAAATLSAATGVLAMLPLVTAALPVAANGIENEEASCVETSLS